MATIKILNMSGKEVGTMELNDSVFAIEPSEASMHMMVCNYLNNQRHGTQSALTRAEVSGGGKKPYRQKGTGRARQGSTRAPQWTHGGIAFAPKPRDYGFSVNKKIRSLAMRSALSTALSEGKITVIDNITLPEIKTRSAVEFLKAIGIDGKALIITPEIENNVVLSARNIPGVKTTVSSVINVYDILNAGNLIIDKAAVEKIQEVYAQ